MCGRQSLPCHWGARMGPGVDRTVAGRACCGRGMAGLTRGLVTRPHEPSHGMDKDTGGL